MPEDKDKTKEQLIEELVEVRKRCGELEGTEEALEATAQQLGERVKELTCLYGIAELAADHERPLDEILQGAVEVIPPSWQFPDVTCARLTLGDKTFQTDQFRETAFKQSANLVFNKKQLGTLEICYLEEKPRSDEGPFLKEERNLIDDVADRLARVVGKRQTEEQISRQVAIVSSSIDMLALLDGNFIYLFANEAYAAPFGKTVGEIVGHTVTEVVGEEFFNAAIKPSAERCLSGETVKYEAWRELPVGGRMYLDITYAPYRSSDNSVLGFLVNGRDITERKQAEQARLDLEKQVQQTRKLESLGILAGGIAHDFNNLLMGVLGNADLALASLSPVSPATENIEGIQQSARRAAELANQMLAYSGKGQFVVQPVSLSEVVQEMGHLLDAAIPKTTILKYELDERVPAVDADVTQLRQVVMNLIANAAEALEDESGVVTLSTGLMECDAATHDEDFDIGYCPLGTHSYVEVSDTGVGMNEDTVSKMFDPFFSTKFTGRGLGMAALSGIVRGHNGAIKVESELGKGTVIRVLFPTTGKPTESFQPSAAAEATSTVGGTVLFVDDEPTVIEATERMLEMSGYEVKTARDGVEAVEVFKEHEQDIACVILDLTMPKMNGEQTFVELQKINSSVPVLLSSGYSFAEVESRVATTGFAGFIQKPYRLKDLRKSLGNVLTE